MNRDECPTRYLLYGEEIAVEMMGEDFVAIQSTPFKLFYKIPVPVGR